MDSISLEECEWIAEYIDDTKMKQEFRQDDFMIFLKKKTSFQKANELFEKAVQQGVFHQNKNKTYIIPIPSMKTWFLEKFQRNKRELYT